MGELGGSCGAMRAKRPAPEFRTATESVIALHEPGWRDSRAADRWRGSMRLHAFPKIGSLPVDAIGPHHVIEVLSPIWQSKRETARRVRRQLRRTLQWARAHGYADGPNPVDAATAALPRQRMPHSPHPAVPHSQVREVLERVMRSVASAGSRLSLCFLVATATRGGETRLADWREIDLASRVWTIPPDRTKTGRPHRVPLSAAAVEILAQAGTVEGLVFRSPVTDRHFSDSTHSKLMRELGLPGVPHGFRSSFRDWCSDAAFPRELAEISLGHVFYGEVEKCYARSDLLDRRRPLIEAWGAYALPAGLNGGGQPSAAVGTGPGGRMDCLPRQPQLQGSPGTRTGDGQPPGNPDGATQPADRIVRIREVCRISGLSRSSVYRMSRNGQFPSALRLSETQLGWRLSEINRWMQDLLPG